MGGSNSGCTQEQGLSHPRLLCPSQGLRSQGASPDIVTPGLRAAGHLLCSPLRSPKRRSWPGGCTSPPPALQPAVRHRRHPREVSVPRRPGQSQPVAMLLPRDGESRGKPEPRTAFFFLRARRAQQPSTLHQPRKSPRVPCAPTAHPLTTNTTTAMRHVESPTWSHSPGKKPSGWETAPCVTGPGVSHTAPRQAAGRAAAKTPSGAELARCPFLPEPSGKRRLPKPVSARPRKSGFSVPLLPSPRARARPQSQQNPPSAAAQKMRVAGEESELAG